MGCKLKEKDLKEFKKGFEQALFSGEEKYEIDKDGNIKFIEE